MGHLTVRGIWVDDDMLIECDRRKARRFARRSGERFHTRSAFGRRYFEFRFKESSTGKQ